MMDLADIAEGGITNPAFLDPHESPKASKKVDRFGIADNRVQPTTIEDVVEEESHQIKNNCNLFRLIPLPCFHIFLKPQWILVFLCWASTIQVRFSLFAMNSEMFHRLCLFHCLLYLGKPVSHY